MAIPRRYGCQGFLAFAVAALLGAPWFMTRLAPHDQSRIVQALLSALAPVLLLLSASRSGLEAPKLPRGVLLAAGLLLALMLASTATTTDRAAAAQDMAHHLGLVGLALAFCAALSTQRPPWFERGLALAPTGLAVVMVLIYAASLAEGQPLNARQMHIGFSNPRFLNHAQTVFVPWLVLVFAQNESQRAWRRLTWLAATVHVAIAYLDVARGTWLAWGIACLILWLHGAHRQCRRLVVMLAVGLLTGVLIADLLPAWGTYRWDLPFASKAAAGGAHSRDQLLAISLDMIRSAPWLGHGGMSFAANTAARATHPHNIYLQWAAEYGLPAMLLAVSLLLALLIKASRQIRSRPTTSRDRTAALLAICSAVLADAMVSGNFVMPVAQIWILLAFGELLAATCTDTSNGPPETAPRWRQTLLAALCASQALLLGVTVDQATREEPRLRESTPVLQSGEKSRPRYWLNGQL